MNILVRRRLTLRGFSDWTVGDLTLVGIENHALRIPAGTYQLLPHESKKECLVFNKGQTYALHNPDLKVWAEESMVPAGTVGRFDCLLHPANEQRELEGCLAPGYHIDIFPDGELGVTHSREAFQDLWKLLGGSEGHTLTIQEAP